MTRISDQILARRMLETHEHGFSFAIFLRRNAPRYAILIACGVLGLLYLTWLDMPTLFYTVLGLLAGCLLRDIGWFRMIRRTWPFTLKVIDWDKVRRLAEAESVDSNK